MLDQQGHPSTIMAILGWTAPDPAPRAIVSPHRNHTVSAQSRCKVFDVGCLEPILIEHQPGISQPRLEGSSRVLF